jgi:hypothetical protein
MASYINRAEFRCQDICLVGFLKHGFESRWGHHLMLQGFPGALARFEDGARDPTSPRKWPESTPEMEITFPIISAKQADLA